MHQHVIAATHAAAATSQLNPNDRGMLALGAAVFVFVVGVTSSLKKKSAS